ncbi:MAG: xylulokinase [Anaerolineae bacterium]|nr:xylulokinase [Anaerolineae bacterium]
MSALMGIDLGTSSLKTVIVTLEGQVVATAAREYEVTMPQPGWAEQLPEAWVEGTLAAIREVLDAARVSVGLEPAQVRAIGLSGQMHGTVCVDVQGRVVRPAIIWADQRSGAQVARVMSEIGPERLGQWTGNPLATGFMLATWLWLREHEPEMVRRTKTVLLPKDYLRYRLTGEIGTEPSDAASTLLFDTARCVWSEPLLAVLDIDVGLLPSVYPSAAIAGKILPEIADATGLLAGTPVIYGGSDQAMQALGHGVIAPGVLSSTIGTGGQLFAPTSSPAYDPQVRLHCFCHVLPGMWHLESAMLSAGMSLRWLRDTVFSGTPYREIADAAASIPPGAEGLFFLPYLVGERTPHMDPRARGAFVGLTLRHGRAHMARAVMEGVVFGLRQGLDLMLGLGVPVARVVASGGAVRHPLWLQLQADIFNRSLYRTETVESAAVGAALLSGVGVGCYTDAPEAVRRTVHWQGSVIEPVSARVAYYAELYATFCTLYPALTDLFHSVPAAG